MLLSSSHYNAAHRFQYLPFKILKRHCLKQMTDYVEIDFIFLIRIAYSLLKTNVLTLDLNESKKMCGQLVI